MISLSSSHSIRVRVGVVATTTLALLACNDDKVVNPPSGGRGGRSEVVLAKEGAPAVTTTAPTQNAHATSSAASKSPRRICEAELTKAARPLPAITKATFGAAGAPDAVAPEARLETGGGRWTWINFFAAWCGPCKEEIPRLRGWEQKLASSLRVKFVSLDDDERQLGKFLGDQPATGVRAALWLKPGPTRDGFLKGLKLAESPSLPAHALIDPQGQVRCAFEGAVDEGDFTQLESIVGRR